MKAKTWILIISAALAAIPSFGEEARYSPGEVHNRMNQIYYWHLAEELNISADQERGMVQILEQSRKKRTELINRHEDSLKALQALPDSGELSKAQKEILAKSLKDYQEAAHELAHVDKDEFDSLRKVFGDPTLAKFLAVRENITERLRNSIRKGGGAQANR
jgi:hypothetical protein